ncbi:unnamed protein product [Parnassius apollo]|uniref:(apollo) hypothetical protein n=1 Tax=Parnassius apollo TaxID=110799 RepID=A0A8S3XBM1_PARAO|nr:unnamed protein product [Parnassius apollo]
METAGKQISTDDDSVLVLEVPLGSTRVVLGRKRYGDRSQLWRRGPGGQLVHEGSSPPQPTDAALPDDPTLSPHAMVLDIEEAAPRPGVASALVLRRADPRRRSTQRWRLLPSGRMACAHANLCVQPHAALAGLMALVPGARVVLGLPASERAGALAGEQAVSWHALRPGCGRLDVTLSCAGPTRLVRIHDHENPEVGRIEDDEEEECGASEEDSEWGVRVAVGGLGVSLVVGAPAAELLYATCRRLRLELARSPAAALLALQLDDLQWDNQLADAAQPVLLQTLRGGGGSGAGGAGAGGALYAAAELVLRPAPAPRYNARYFNRVVVALCPVAVRLDERSQDCKEYVLLAGDHLQENCNVVINTTPIALVCQKLFRLILDQVAISIFLSAALSSTTKPTHYSCMNSDQFYDLLNCIPSLAGQVPNATVALSIYLVKLRTGDSNVTSLGLILLLWSWIEQWRGGEDAAEQPDEVEYETRRVLHELTALHAARYYCALLELVPSQIRLSMYTASKLEAELSALKKRLGLTFVRFEDAAVELEPFVRTHVFDTAAGLARHTLQHFKDELKWQAAKILGSVDFLGNPLGFVADVSEGVSGLLLEGNVGALVKNVTHGISNSAAKVTESLGDGLERVVGDEAHEETRRRLVVYC